MGYGPPTNVPDSRILEFVDNGRIKVATNHINFSVPPYELGSPEKCKLNPGLAGSFKSLV